MREKAPRQLPPKARAPPSYTGWLTTPSLKPQPLTAGSTAWALASSFLWGGNLVALKVGLEVFPPFWSAWWRFFLATVAVGLWARSQKITLVPAASERRPLLILGSLFGAQIVLLNLGLEFTSPAYGVVILNAYPIFSNLVGHFVASEQRLSRMRMLGLAVAFGGVCYLAIGHPVERLASNPLLGNSLLVVSSVLLGVRLVFTRHLVQTITPVKAVVWQTLIALPLFLGPAVLFEPAVAAPLRTGPVVALLYQGLVVATLCFIIWTHLLRRHSAGTLAMFAFTVPLFGILLSAIVFAEPITGRVLLAAGLVTVGIAVVMRSSHPAPRDVRQP